MCDQVLVTMGDWSAVQVRCQRTKSFKVYFWHRVLNSTTYDPPPSLVAAGMVPPGVQILSHQCHREGIFSIASSASFAATQVPNDFRISEERSD